MIISREYAKNISKNNLADLATRYAEGLAKKLGYEGQVAIQPQEIICDKKEAERFFLPKLKPSDYPKDLKKFVKSRYDLVSKYDLVKIRVKEKEPFVYEDVAYIPISELSKSENELVLEIIGKYNGGLVKRFWRRICGKKGDYLTLDGFGSEVAHLIGRRLYGQKEHGGLEEALDIFSQLYESLWDIQTLSKTNEGNKIDLESLENRLVNENVKDKKLQLELYETMLFGKDGAVKQRLVEEGVCNNNTAELTLRLFKRRYIDLYHFEGIKLFVEIYDGVEGNLDKAYIKLGEILSDSRVMTMESALLKLGYSEDRMLRYKGVFEKNRVDRAERVYGI